MESWRRDPVIDMIVDGIILKKFHSCFARVWDYIKQGLF